MLTKKIFRKASGGLYCLAENWLRILNVEYEWRLSDKFLLTQWRRNKIDFQVDEQVDYVQRNTYIIL